LKATRIRIKNWLVGPWLSEANSRNCEPAELEIPGGDTALIKLARATDEGKISYLNAKKAFNMSITSTKLSPFDLIERENLYQVSDDAALDGHITAVIKDNPRSVADFKNGKSNVLMFLVGQVMKKSQGKANPKLAQEILKRRLSDA